MSDGAGHVRTDGCGRAARDAARSMLEVAEADKMITLGGSAREAPVLTSEGVVHVGQEG